MAMVSEMRCLVASWHSLVALSSAVLVSLWVSVWAFVSAAVLLSLWLSLSLSLGRATRDSRSLCRSL